MDSSKIIVPTAVVVEMRQAVTPAVVRGEISRPPDRLEMRPARPPFYSGFGGITVNARPSALSSRSMAPLVRLDQGTITRRGSLESQDGKLCRRPERSLRERLWRQKARFGGTGTSLYRGKALMQFGPDVHLAC